MAAVDIDRAERLTASRTPIFLKRWPAWRVRDARQSSRWVCAFLLREQILTLFVSAVLVAHKFSWVAVGWLFGMVRR